MCCEIFVVIIVGYKKNRKKEAVQALCRPRQTAKTPLPSVADGKGGTWRPPVLPGVDHLANLPTVANGKAWLTAKTSPLPSAGRTAKKTGAEVLLMSPGGRQRGALICRPLVDGKGRR